MAKVTPAIASQKNTSHQKLKLAAALCQLHVLRMARRSEKKWPLLTGLGQRKAHLHEQGRGLPRRINPFVLFLHVIDAQLQSKVLLAQIGHLR